MKKFDLSNVKKVSIVLETCETFDFDAKDIVDAYFDESTFQKRYGKGKNVEYNASYGKITIASNALHTWSAWYDPERSDYDFYDRIKMFCDVCIITFDYGMEQYNIRVPYDTLESSLHGCEIEYSNCPSCELDEKGNLVILFGKLSKAPKRKDNDYANIVKGWENSCLKNFKNILNVENLNFSHDCYSDGKTVIELICKILNKGYNGKQVKFKFKNVENLNFSLFFDMKEQKDNLLMTKLTNGKIYVQLEACVTFFCSSVNCCDW